METRKERIDRKLKHQALLDFVGNSIYHHDGIEREGRFLLITSAWNDKGSQWREAEWLDTEEECNMAIQMFNDLFKDTPSPVLMKNKYPQYYRPWTGEYAGCYLYEDGALFHGFMVLDYENETLAKSGGKGVFGVPWDYKSHKLEFKDRWFRKKGEIPKNYVWANGEYEGWLQFRWGDGKNAIDYVEPKKGPKKSMAMPKENIDIEELTEEEKIQEEYENQMATEKLKFFMEKCGW